MSLHAIQSITLGISEYTGLDILAIARYNGEVYGITATGLYQLNAAGEEVVEAHIQTGKQDFGSMEEKRLDRVHIKAQYADDLLLSTLVDEVDANEETTEVAYEYTVPGKTGTRPQIRTERTRRDVLGLGWAFKIANVDGGQLSIKGLFVEPDGIDIDS